MTTACIIGSKQSTTSLSHSNLDGRLSKALVSGLPARGQTPKTTSSCCIPYAGTASSCCIHSEFCWKGYCDGTTDGVHDLESAVVEGELFTTAWFSPLGLSSMWSPVRRILRRSDNDSGCAFYCDFAIQDGMWTVVYWDLDRKLLAFERKTLLTADP